MRIRNILLGAAAMAALAISVAPAHADWRDDHWRREHWRHEEWRRDHWRGYGYYAPPPVYYAPPPVYYAPPPVYYSPGVTLGFTIR